MSKKIQTVFIAGDVWKSKDGLGVIEILIILLAVELIVLMFHNQITGFIIFIYNQV